MMRLGPVESQGPSVQKEEEAGGWVRARGGVTLGARLQGSMVDFEGGGRGHKARMQSLEKPEKARSQILS